jgi:hypothetical protein
MLFVYCLLSSLVGTQRLWRSMIFREQLNVKVFNCNSLIQDRIWWQEPVHLTAAGYDRLASHITTCFSNLVRKNGGDQEDDILDEGIKKQKTEEAGPSRRLSNSSWLACSDNFVAVPRGGFRGRGGFYRGRFSKPSSGNQGWRGYRY